MFTLTQWALLSLWGTAVSSLGTLVGLGGGAFMVPVLVLAFGIPLKTAIASVTFCLFPSALLSTIFNLRRGHIDFHAALYLEIPTVAGTFLGSWLTGIFPVRPLEILFAVFIGYLGLRLLRSKDQNGKTSLVERMNRIAPVVNRKRGDQTYQMGVPALGIFGVFAGTVAGLFGVGGGIIKTPVMLKIFRMPHRTATATALFMITFTTASASFSHWRFGHMDWRIALPLSGSFLLGSFLSNMFGQKIRSHTLVKLLALSLCAVSAVTIVHALFILPT